jgi:hypothetical protein
VLRNRNNIYAYSTIYYRDSNKSPQNKHKIIAIVLHGTNRMVFNSYDMAILNTQGVSLEQLNNKYSSEISKIIDFSVKINPDEYRHHEIKYSNFI